MKPSENPLGSEPISTLLRRFAVPSVIAMLVSALYNMVDQLFIGHSIGVLGNAATNVAFPLSMVCTSIGLLCGIGGAANFNLCMGRKDPEHAKSYVGNAISMLAILGVILCVAVQLFLRPMMLLFGATPDVIDYACTYTRITSIGFPFLIVTIGGSNLIRADGSPKFSMLCNLSAQSSTRFSTRCSSSFSTWAWQVQRSPRSPDRFYRSRSLSSICAVLKRCRFLFPI